MKNEKNIANFEAFCWAQTSYLWRVKRELHWCQGREQTTAAPYCVVLHEKWTWTKPYQIIIGKKWAADLLEKFQSLNGVSQHYQDVTWIPSEKWPSWRDWDVVCLAHTQSFVFKKNWRRPKDGSKMTDLSLTCTHNSDWMAHRNRTGLKHKQTLNYWSIDKCPIAYILGRAGLDFFLLARVGSWLLGLLIWSWSSLGTTSALKTNYSGPIFPSNIIQIWPKY